MYTFFNGEAKKVFEINATLQMFAGIYGESTFRTCKNDRKTLYRGKPQKNYRENL